MTITEDRLDETFAALADPTRRKILTRLAKGEATVNQLAEPFDLTLQAVSKHIKVLEKCGLDLPQPARPVPAVPARAAGARRHRGVDRAEPPDLDRALRPARQAPASDPTGNTERRGIDHE